MYNVFLDEESILKNKDKTRKEILDMQDDDMKEYQIEVLLETITKNKDA
jgi:hypothetical protein